MKKFLIPALVILAIFLGIQVFKKVGSIQRPPQSVQPAVAPSPRPVVVPVATPIPTPVSSPTPTPTPTPTPRVTRVVSLNNVGAVQAVSSLQGMNLTDVVILPNSTNDAVIVIGSRDSDLRAAEGAIHAFDQSQRLITIYALVGRYSQEKGHAVGLFDYLATNAAQAQAQDVAQILANVAVDLTTGVATVGGTVTARLVLEMMSQFSSSNGLFRVESRPTMTTLSGQAASFTTGKEIPVSTTVNGVNTSQTSIDYKKADFSLQVIPTLRPDGSVRLVLKQSNSEVIGSIRVNGNDVPTIATQTADTVVDLKPGQLLYLGGIKTAVDERSQKGVPYVGNVFPLSLIMGRSTARKEQGELVIVLAVEVRGAGEVGQSLFDRDFVADPDGLIAAPGQSRFRAVDTRKTENPQERGPSKSQQKNK